MAKWVAIAFGALLVVTNGAWLYGAVDLAVTEKYRQQISYENENRLNALNILSNHFVTGMKKNELRELLESLYPDTTPFEKEGYLHTTWLGFRLSTDGKSVEGVGE